MGLPKQADRTPFLIFIALLAWLPIPLGSNRPWASSLFSCVTFGLCIWWCVLYHQNKVSIPRSFRKAWVVILALFVCQLWVFISIKIPHTAGGSLDPSSSFLQLLLGLSLTAIFCLTLLLLRSEQHIKITIYTLILSGICQAIYGSLMTLSGIEYILFWPKSKGLGTAIGTFINRNQLAGYLELCLAVGIGYMITNLKDSAARNWRDFSRRLLNTLLGTKALVRIGLVIMVAALVMTHSRMGNTAFFASLAITGVIALALGKQASRATIILLSSLIIIDIAVVGTFFGVKKVVDRIEQTTLGTIRRDEVNEHALPLLADNLLTGTGAGSFYGVFPEYRKEDIGKIYFDEAHNDYLQFAIEFGLIGFLPLLAAVLLSFTVALRAQWQRRDPLMRGLSFSAIMATIAYGIHSTVDYNLQIPSNAATFMVIMAMGWLSLYFKERGKSESQE